MNHMSEAIADEIKARGFELEDRGVGWSRILFNGQVVLDPETSEAVTLAHYLETKEQADEARETLIRSSVLEAEEPEEEQEESDPEREFAPTLTPHGALVQLSDRLRARFEPMGTWKGKNPHGSMKGPRNTYAEVGRVAYLWAEREGITPLPKNLDSAHMMLYRIYRNDGGLSEVGEYLNRFLDHLDSYEDPGDRYRELRAELLFPDEEPEQPEAEVEAEEQPEQPEQPEPMDEALRLSGEAIQELRERERKLIEERDTLSKQNDSLVTELADLETQLEQAKEDYSRLESSHRATVQDGANGKIPELAFECLAEMLGQQVTVAGDSDEALDYSALMTMMDDKRQRAIALAKKIAELEVGAPSE